MIRTRSVRRLGTAALATAVLATAIGVTERDVGACSCGGPDTTLLGPERVDDAPLNSKVRVEVPSWVLSSQASTGPANGGLVLRVHGRAAPVAVSARISAPGGSSSLVELTPSAPLEPSTRYEVATVDANAVPPNRVFGTFRTGRSTDTVPPRIDAMGPAVAYKNSQAVGSMCMVPGPWVTIEGVVLDDPGRSDAQLLLAVWLGDANGAIDAKKPPTSFVRAHGGRVDLGQTSLCDPHAFPFPKAAFAWLGVAAVDEAGNTSAVRRVRVDLAGARQP